MTFLKVVVVSAALAAMLSHACAAEMPLSAGTYARSKAAKLKPGKPAGLLEARHSGSLLAGSLGNAGSAFMAVVGYGLGSNQVSIVATTGTTP